MSSLAAASDPTFDVRVARMASLVATSLGAASTGSGGGYARPSSSFVAAVFDLTIPVAIADHGRPLHVAVVYGGVAVDGLRGSLGGHGGGGDTTVCFFGSTYASHGHSLQRRPGERELVPVSCAISIKLSEETENEIDLNDSILSSHKVICRFKGFWPSHPNLHAWISENLGSLIYDKIHIYPMAKGFFIANFKKAKERFG
ncbi:hypothetical protein SUGI_1173910 [Cryptomeria japonica]|nr:hypothetical protein SUGI_1173910 [Cryptomeria japonica]